MDDYKIKVMNNGVFISNLLELIRFFGMNFANLNLFIGAYPFIWWHLQKGFILPHYKQSG